MILKNKLTKETLDINYDEFRKKLAKELKAAFESFKKLENAKPYFKLKDYTEQDFYFNLQWNLRLAGRVRSAFAKQNTQTRLTPANKHNHFGNSVWYIERL